MPSNPISDDQVPTTWKGCSSLVLDPQLLVLPWLSLVQACDPLLSTLDFAWSLN